MEKQQYEMIKEEVQNKVLQCVDYSKEVTDLEIRDLIDEVISTERGLKVWKVQEKIKLSKDVFSSLRGWDILQQLLEDNSVTEIMINGTDGIYIERACCKTKVLQQALIIYFCTQLPVARQFR